MVSYSSEERLFSKGQTMSQAQYLNGYDDGYADAVKKIKASAGQGGGSSGSSDVKVPVFIFKADTEESVEPHSDVGVYIVNTNGSPEIGAYLADSTVRFVAVIASVPNDASIMPTIDGIPGISFSQTGVFKADITVADSMRYISDYTNISFFE